MTKTFFIPTAICVAASYAAYTEQMNYDPTAEARDERVVEENIARSVATEAMQEQYRCLANDPSDWCNRDLSYQDHLQAAQATAKEHRGVYNIADHTKDRNFYIFVPVISGLVAIVQLCRKGQSNSSGEI